VILLDNKRLKLPLTITRNSSYDSILPRTSKRYRNVELTLQGGLL
jgi:hypothetical protein